MSKDRMDIWLEGERELFVNMQKKLGRLGKAGRQALQKGGMIIVNDAKVNLRNNGSVVTGMLRASGKVRHFGVSNMNPGQIENLKRCVKQDIIVDQVEMSLAHCPAIDAGIHANMMEDAAIMRDGSLLDYAQCKGMGIQAWSILQISLHGGSFLDNPEYPRLNEVLQRLGEKYSVSKAAIATAWLLRHPAKIQAIAGTTNPQHLREIAKAADICLTRPEWYELYCASGKTLP